MACALGMLARSGVLVPHPLPGTLRREKSTGGYEAFANMSS